MALHKSIAYLMIITLLFTLFPGVSFGASDNRITRVVTVGQNEVLDAQAAPRIVLDLKDELDPEDTFYLLLEGAEWAVGTGVNEIAGEILGMPQVESSPRLEVTKINKGELQVRVKEGMVLPGASIRIPLQAKIKELTASVRVQNNNTAVSTGTYVFAKAMDFRGRVTSTNVKTATGSAVMADLVLDEPFSEAFKKAVLEGKSNKLQIILNSNDYEFVLDMPSLGVPSLRGIKGFDTLSGGIHNLRRVDAQTLELTLPDLSNTRHTGGFILSGVGLRTTKQSPARGMITATVQGDLVFNNTVNVLEVTDYGIGLTVSSSLAVTSGKSKQVSFTLEEKVHQSLIRERLTTFTFTEGVRVKLNAENKVDVTLNGTTMSFHPIYQNGKAVGFEVPQLPGTAMKYDFVVTAEVPAKVEGEVQLLAEGRSLLNPLTMPALQVTPPVRVMMEPMHLRLGLKDQTGGKVTISETAKGEIRQDASIIIKIEDSQVLFTQPPVVRVTSGDIRLGTAKLIAGGIEVPVVRRSNEASTIEIDSFLVTVNQMVAEGIYKAEIGGAALSDLTSGSDIDAQMSGSFMIISKDGPSAPKNQVAFTIGQAAYTVNEQRKAMDAAPYIRNGRTMLPIKYVALALGISEHHVLWNGTTRTVTVLADQKIELQIGSTVMRIDGVPRQMSAPPEITSDRTFVPVAEITRALGVDTRWDEATRTVLFN